jgi:hypothetical protein
MRNISEQTVARTNGVFTWFSGFIGLTRVLGGILLLALLHNPTAGLSVTLPGPYSVALAWDRSPDSSVTGYRVYYGTASGKYTNSVTVGNVTTNTVPGLEAGVTYFFAIIGFTASGIESASSNEISYMPGLPMLQMRVMANKQAVLTVKGLIGKSYDILATQTFTGWTVVGTVTLGVSASSDFTDTNAPSFAKRYYRTQKTP